MAQVGSKNHKAKLTEADVQHIRFAYEVWLSCSPAQLAKLHKVSKSTIDNIIARKSWKHVKKDTK